MTAGAIAVPTIIPLRAPVPGRPKTSVDSNTKIELQSDTSNTDIYYTINGSRPEPFLPIGRSDKCTMKYTGPFTLPAGKQSVKALAIHKDGLRESNIVTKMFEVEYVPAEYQHPGDDDLGFQEDLENERSKLQVKRAAKNLMLSTKSAWTDVRTVKDTAQMLADMKVGGSERRKPGTGTRFMNNRMGTTDRGVSGSRMYDMTVDDMELMDTERRHQRFQPPETSTQTLQLQRKTDFLKCVYCFADRPSDPYSRFCHTCGNPVPELPQTRISPPDPGQMGMCVYCKSVVPFNTGSCVVCEGPIPQQNQPQASVKLLQKRVCTLCGTANPNNISMCITCDSRLPTTSQPLFSGESAPPIPKTDTKWMKCTKCSRVNNGDARFCDWCGAKPTQSNNTLTCSKCSATNHSYASYCGTCGIKMEAPLRNSLRPIGDSITSLSAQWLPVSFPLGIPGKPATTVATQTVGLFYPSTRGIEKKQEDDEDKLNMEKQMRDRRPLLTNVSPGRGYWRKQLDHICAHLRAYGQNDAEFRALIGEPRMGKLISGSVHEDAYELSLTLNFTLRNSKDPFKGKQLGYSRDNFLSSRTERDSMSGYGSQTSLNSNDRVRPRKKKSARRPKKVKKESDNIAAEDQRLLKEIGSKGEGRPTEIQQLLDEDADANCINKDGYPVMHIAVRNSHVDAIRVLIDAGADINRKGPSCVKGNTALHEAVNLGPSASSVLDALLENGADINKKNDRGETPYDLAVKSGFESVVTKFAASLGQNHLEKMMKPKQSIGAY